MIRFAIVVGGGWALINGLAYAADFSKRYRAEAAWFLFAAVLLIAAVDAIMRGAVTGDRQRLATPHQLAIAFVTLLALGVALYFPILSLGLLSDDFVLLSHARSGVFADRSWDYLRPLPLVIWSGLNQLVEPKAVPTLLHAFSIALHARLVNAIACSPPTNRAISAACRRRCVGCPITSAAHTSFGMDSWKRSLVCGRRTPKQQPAASRGTALDSSKHQSKGPARNHRPFAVV